MLQIDYKYKGCYVENDFNTNIFIAAFTTANARLRLYEMLGILGEPVCKTWFLPKGVIPQYLIINRSDSSIHIKLDNLSYSHTIIYNRTHFHLIQSFK
jgi:hypothetical protein